jgi:hypothetical protein
MALISHRKHISYCVFYKNKLHETCDANIIIHNKYRSNICTIMRPMSLYFINFVNNILSND